MSRAFFLFNTVSCFAIAFLLYTVHTEWLPAAHSRDAQCTNPICRVNLVFAKVGLGLMYVCSFVAALGIFAALHESFILLSGYAISMIFLVMMDGMLISLAWFSPTSSEITIVPPLTVSVPIMGVFLFATYLVTVLICRDLADNGGKKKN